MSSQEATANEGCHDDEGIPPADLLALLELASGIGDGNFIDAIPGAQNLRSDFRIKTPPRCGEPDTTHDVSRYDLVSGLHVGQRRVVQDVRQQCYQTIAHAVPEIHRFMLAEKPGAV